MSKQAKFTPTIPVYMHLSMDELVDALSRIETSDFMDLVMKMSDCFAVAEVDEELVARHWRAVQKAYGAEDAPTLENILRRFPEAKP